MAYLRTFVPDDKVNDVVDAFANKYKYQVIVDGQQNPESKLDFAKRMVAEYIRAVYKEHIVAQAIAAKDAEARAAFAAKATLKRAAAISSETLASTITPA